MADDGPDDDGKVETVEEIHQTAERVRRGLPRLVHDEGGHIPAFKPSLRQREGVAMMVANRVPVGIIAMLLDISVPSLAKHFKKEIKYGRDHIIARVGNAVLQKALKGNVPAARYWLMTHGGPEWQLSKRDAEAEAAAFGREESSEGGRKRVTFYLPQNNRDKPEPEPSGGPLIDGEATGTHDT